jgi:hypothetical protein
MNIKVKAQPGQVCRLSEELCVSDKETQVKLTTFVRRRLRDGSLIECKKRGKS